MTYVVDACTSGTMAKAFVAQDAGAAGVKAVPAARLEGARLTLDPDPQLVDSDQRDAFQPSALPRVSYLGAAQDGTVAIERQGRGVFTEALVRTLAEAQGGLTYRQAGDRVRALVAQSGSPQIPDLSGDLDRVVLGEGASRGRHAWRVREVKDDALVLTGAPLPGWAEDAEVAIYPAAAPAAALSDPSQATVQVLLTKVSGVQALGVPMGPLARPIQPGDQAVLLRGGFAQMRLALMLDPALPANVRDAVQEELRSDKASLELVAVVGAREGAFWAKPSAVGGFDLYGPVGVLRNHVSTAEALAEAIRLHALQRPLMGLQGEPGPRLSNDGTLKVHLVRMDDSAELPSVQGVFQVPVCQRYRVEVEYAAPPGSPKLEIGGALLSNDGSILGFPEASASGNVVLGPGERATVLSGAFMMPPVGVPDGIVVVGLPEGANFPWHLTSQAAVSTKGLEHPLSARLLRYVRAADVGAKAISLGEGASSKANTEPWVTTRQSVQGLINPEFDDATHGKVTKKEYTLQGFDLRPYLPGNASSALGRVLRTADRLARFASTGDGVGYRQHGWSTKAPDPKTSDELNLRVGLDCSRAIWFAFTRADGYGPPPQDALHYNQGDAYLPTALMAAPDSKMAEAFERCDDAEIEIGDVLVYRRAPTDPKRRQDGHAVMVIDPERLIAWGSHAFDGTGGNSRLRAGDIGVEYQRIGTKRGLTRWDSAHMVRVACWRHRRFAEERRSGVSEADPRTLTDFCRR